ncbi:MAG: hypothetical protein AAGJ81_12390 [Verrucomicrobiota bacterium]
MCNRPFRILALALSPLLSSSAQTGLTIYNENFAVVRDSVPLQLSEGSQEISYSGVTSQLEPESVVLRDKSGTVDLRILEQSYRGDPVNQERLLQFFEGETISFQNETESGEQIIEGKIIRAPTRSSSGFLEPILLVDGLIRLSLPGQPLFPDLGDGSILRPTLSWKIYSPTSADIDAELSYLTNGLSWKSDYNLILPEKGDAVSLTGWVSLTNRSGKSFSNSQIKLIAGDVNKVIEVPQASADFFVAKTLSEAAPPSVEERKFDEFHLYSLPEQTDLRDQETKQLEFVRADPIETKKTYVYDGSLTSNYRVSSAIEDPNYGRNSQPDVAIYREFKNSENNNLGVPLPAGTVRFYRTDIDGQIEFIGENTIDHTPKNELVRLYLGNAFDIVGERRVTDFFRHTRQDLIRESFEIEVRNRSEEEVTVKVVENLYRWVNWEIVESSVDFEKVDARSIGFSLIIPAEETGKVTYTVEYTW